MNNTLLGAAVAVVAIAMQAGAYANDADSQEQRTPHIKGVWLLEVTLRNCATGEVAPVPNPVFPALNTFHEGGTMSEHGSRLSPALRGVGQGVWKRTGHKTFESRFVFQLFDVNGLFTGTQDVKRTMRLSDDGASLSMKADVAITDPNGVLLLRGCATEVGERLEL